MRLALLLSLLASSLASAAAAAQPAGGALRLAVLVTDDKLQLQDILSGQARVGFNPLVGQGISLQADPGRTIWLRVRADFDAAGGRQYLSLSRQPIESMRLYVGGEPEFVAAQTSINRVQGTERWPDALVVPIPDDPKRTGSVYLAIKGRGLLNLQPLLLDEAGVRAQRDGARRLYGLLYGSLLLIGVLAVIRRWTGAEPGYRLAQAAFACLVAALVDANHLQLTVAGSPLGTRHHLAIALWLLAGAALLRATRQYAGHEKNTPDVAKLLDYVSYGLAAISLAVLFVPTPFLPQLQVAGLAGLAVVALVCAVSLLLDPRHWRWTPMLVWGGVLFALAAIPLAWAQLMPLTVLVRRGFQLMLALLLGAYLVLPWLRAALRERAKHKRVVVLEASAEEKIAHAREWLVNSLRAGMEVAGEADMEWIAYRRLMAGLKPVLPQTASAVIAMNYHNEDLLLVEPRDAEARFRMLLTQRASLLKNLSRSLAPQQIVLDFDGPEGPLDHVMLAIIPLPIQRPGWGALVIERDQESNYSELELDLCAEFAALATTAADEAAEVMQKRRTSEIDADTGAYRGEFIETLIQQAMEMSIQKRKPLSVLRVAIDGFEKLPAGAAPALARSVTDSIRDEIDFGETIGRRSPEEFLVLLVGRAAGEVRTLGERICTEVRRHPLATGQGALTVSIGVAQMQSGERSPQLMLERSAKALEKARSYGGNQAQMVSGTGP